LKKITLTLISILFFSGCATFSPSKELFREKENINAKTFSAPFEACFNAVKQVFLNKNFALSYEDKKTGRLQGTRFFQKGKRTITVVITADLQSLGEDRTIVYLNAVQTSEKLFTKGHTRFFLWLIPLPGGGGETAERLKEGKKTIEDKNFYQLFFKDIGAEIQAVLRKQGLSMRNLPKKGTLIAVDMKELKKVEDKKDK